MQIPPIRPYFTPSRMSIMNLCQAVCVERFERYDIDASENCVPLSKLSPECGHITRTALLDVIYKIFAYNFLLHREKLFHL